MKTKLTMKIFTGLKKIREFERRQLSFLKSIVDFDIVIDIGYAEEQEQPLTLKRLLLLNIAYFGDREQRFRPIVNKVESGCAKRDFTG